MESNRLLALIDANLNRCREGLRVLDDVARFVLSDSSLCEKIKQLRHGVVQAESPLRRDAPDLIHHRDVARDVGTAISVPGEFEKTNSSDIAAANVRRVQESLRSLEEFGKLVSRSFAEQIKQLRYRSYELEQDLLLLIEKTSSDQASQLQDARIYVLITESLCHLPWKQVVQECLKDGADVLQLREKDLSGSTLLRRARWFCDACRDAGRLAIINDRPDIAILAEADGVHLGQDDLAVSETTRLVDTKTITGLSTHNPEQLKAAIDSKADYFGVGPVFSSSTKDFSEFAGLEYVRHVAATADRPWFAIGGIEEQNIAKVLAAGATRIAVCGDVIRSDAPARRLAELASAMRSAVLAQSPMES